MGEIKLKPCPFCGGKAILVEHPLGSLWITKCTHCGTTSGVKNRREYAEMAWNKRVGQVSEKAVRNIVKPEFLHMISDTRYIAKCKCGKRITADIDDRYNPNFCSKCGAEFDWSEDGG